MINLHSIRAGIEECRTSFSQGEHRARGHTNQEIGKAIAVGIANSAYACTKVVVGIGTLHLIENGTICSGMDIGQASVRQTAKVSLRCADDDIIKAVGVDITGVRNSGAELVIVSYTIPLVELRTIYTGINVRGTDIDEGSHSGAFCSNDDIIKAICVDIASARHDGAEVVIDDRTVPLIKQ